MKKKLLALLNDNDYEYFFISLWSKYSQTGESTANANDSKGQR